MSPRAMPRLYDAVQEADDARREWDETKRPPLDAEAIHRADARFHAAFNRLLDAARDVLHPRGERRP